MARTLVGSRIRERREAIGLRQSDVARRSGISPSYLNLIEHNRRGIAGKVLIDIAAVLGMDVTALLEGADAELIRSLQTAAAATGEQVEIERVEELVSRFPGWARMIAGLQRRAAGLERTVDALSDRLTHDPFLAESLHEMLSSVTAIHATSGILADAKGMEVLQQRRFQANIHDESGRLSELSQGLVSYFDKLSEGEKSLSTPFDEVEAFLDQHQFHFAVLEGDGTDAIGELIRNAEELESQSSRAMARVILTRYCDDAARLPLEALLEEADSRGFQPTELARAFQVPLAAMHRRLAFLPQIEGNPEFGLIVCDGAGAVLLRKSLQGFSLPRYASACALWPLYQALTRPHSLITSSLATPENRVFRAEAQAVYQDLPDGGAAPVIRSSMLFQLARRQDQDTGAVEVGLSCRICPRTECSARREPSIHALANQQ